MSAGAGQTTPRLRILHAHSAFSLGGKEARAARLMNAFGNRAVHTVLSAMPDQLDARNAIDPDIAVDYPTDAPSLQGRPGPGRYAALARYMRDFDLILTYNWGAMDVVMAHRLFRLRHRLPPLIHHEDGFNADESVKRKPARTWFRRIALTGADALVVPSQTLARIATREWGAGRKLHLIANAVRVDLYAAPPALDAIPGFVRPDGDIVIGTIAGLRAVKDIPALVGAVAALPDRVQLVIVGEGPERDAIIAVVRDAGIADRVHLPGFLADPWRYVGLFDIFSLSSLSEQAPISMIEAMAAGLPVAAYDVGDIAAMLPAAQHELLAPPGNRAALTAALAALVADPTLRRTLGLANCAQAKAHHDERTMIAAYAGLYGRAIGRSDALLASGR